MTILDPNLVNNLSSLIQISVAPVFLIAGVAGLLNVFTGRLARVIDKVDKADISKQNDPKIIIRRSFLIRRMESTNLAIFFCTTTGLLIALVIVTMFLATLFGFHGSTLIAVLFILAMFCLILSFIVFLKEIYFTTSFIRSQKR